jgi:hypothetical protein
MFLHQSPIGKFVPMPARPYLCPNPLFQALPHKAVELLEFQGAVSNAEVVPPYSNYSIEEFYHFGKPIAQSHSLLDEMVFASDGYRLTHR